MPCPVHRDDGLRPVFRAAGQRRALTRGAILGDWTGSVSNADVPPEPDSDVPATYPTRPSMAQVLFVVALLVAAVAAGLIGALVGGAVVTAAAQYAANWLGLPAHLIVFSGIGLVGLVVIGAIGAFLGVRLGQVRDAILERQEAEVIAELLEQIDQSKKRRSRARR